MESAVLFCFVKHIGQASKLAEEMALKIAKVFRKSVTSDPMEQICDIIYYMNENHIDRLAVPTCLTLSTKVAEFLSFIHTFEEYGISLTILEPKIDAINNGVMNPQFKMIIDIMSQFYIIQQRAMMKKLQKAHLAYRAYLNNGGKAGRKIGFRKTLCAYRRDYTRELNLLRSGVSLKQCHQTTGVSINTLKKLKSLFNL